MERVVYELIDGRYWDTGKAAFMRPDEVDENIERIRLISAEGESDEKYLAKTLEFYGFALGEVAIHASSETIKKELKRLDEEYLTPRTLADLACGDEYAKALWRKHERLAEPLRKRLEELASE
ncbi:MAG: hypothetical protein K2H64_01940 [Desulfovibrio sp.]|nr:hypothetical protein [Desulfovibrio sp.]